MWLALRAQAAVAAALPGDVILLANGTYTLTARITCNRAGSAAMPIVVRAVTPFGATVESNTLVSAPHWHFEDFTIRGSCATDSDCEHAFQVTGLATDTVLRNLRLVLCRSGGLSMTDTRIGLSFGGGGTAPQFCFPGFNANVPCSVEHAEGVMRNNIIANCSDVGVYLNRAANSSILHNTLVGTRETKRETER